MPYHPPFRGRHIFLSKAKIAWVEVGGGEMGSSMHLSDPGSIWETFFAPSLFTSTTR